MPKKIETDAAGQRQPESLVYEIPGVDGGETLEIVVRFVEPTPEEREECQKAEREHEKSVRLAREKARLQRKCSPGIN